MAMSYPCLGARMRASVLPPKAPRLYPSVGLGRAYAGVAEQLLDGAEVGASLEQMGGERVAQRVRRDARSGRHPLGGETKPATDVRGGEAAAAPRQEQRRLGAPAGPSAVRGREPGPGAREIALQRSPGGLARGP